MCCQHRLLVPGIVAAMVAALLVGTAPRTTAADSRPHVHVYFVQGEQLRPVVRPGRTARDAVRQLITGLTQAERHDGFRTYVPAATRLRKVSVANRLATVDLNRAFVQGHKAGSMLARLSELAGTLTGIQATKRVRLLINGATTTGLFPGIPTGRPITLPPAQSAGRAGSDAAAREAAPAGPGCEGDAATADRAGVHGEGRRRQPPRACDGKRDPRLPEVGRAEPHFAYVGMPVKLIATS